MLRADVQLAWKTQAGHRHQVEGLGNEDSAFVTDDHPLFDAVLMVADGMGGHPRPQEASQTAVRAAREFLWDPARLRTSGDPGRAALAAVLTAHEAVRALHTGATRKPPGTTLSVAVLAGGQAYIAHVGDGSVFLARSGQLQPIAGGENRRAGNRPAEYLGQHDPPAPERKRLELQSGDRLLLCTDGLTRYFGEAGPEALERTLARQGVEIQAIAGQLTAHSRAGEYDDDTTVALVEVGSLREGPDPSPASWNRDVPQTARDGRAERDLPPVRQERPMEATATDRPSRGPARGLDWALGAVVGALLLAGGFQAGRMTASTPAVVVPSGTSATARPYATDAELKSLPPGNLILFDAAGKRVFSLPSSRGALGTEVLSLQAYKIGPAGQLELAGRFRLDPASGKLLDAEGRSYPVEVDASGSTLRVLRGGTLSVVTRPPGARLTVDGKDNGLTPRTLTLPAGSHQVRVEGRGWASESAVDVSAGRATSLILGPTK